MHAIFFMSQRSRFDAAGLEDCHVYLFDTEELAYEFAYKALVDASEISEPADSYEARREAVEEEQNCMGGLEFLHVYPVVDRRVPMTAHREAV